MIHGNQRSNVINDFPKILIHRNFDSPKIPNRREFRSWETIKAFRINELTFELIVDELLNAFKLFIENLVKPFQVPGQFDQENSYAPKIFCSVLGFLGEERGHIVFEQDRLLR